MVCYGKLCHIFLKQLIIQEVTLLNILFLRINNPSKSMTLSMLVLSLVQPPSSDSPAAFDVVPLASVCEVMNYCDEPSVSLCFFGTSWFCCPELFSIGSK